MARKERPFTTKIVQQMVDEARRRIAEGVTDPSTGRPYETIDQDERDAIAADIDAPELTDLTAPFYDDIETQHAALVAETRAEARSDEATAAIVDAKPQVTPVPVDPASWESERFEAFKLDLYKTLIRHKYTVESCTGVVVDVQNLSRMKRQLAIARFVESLERVP